MQYKVRDNIDIGAADTYTSNQLCLTTVRVTLIRPAASVVMMTFASTITTT